MLWFSPRASVRSDAVKAEAKQVVEEGAAFLASPPTLDAVIVKATASVGTSIMNLSHTESFVFAKNSKGVWEYTEKYDEQFAKLGL